MFYIKYPKNQNKPVKVVSHRPKPSKNYGFAEGSFKTLKLVCWRLNNMNIPNYRRPKKVRC